MRLKRAFVLFTICVLLQTSAFAIENCTITLKEGKTYAIFLQERPVQIYVTNPKILSAQSTSDLFNRNFQINLKSKTQGSTDLLITTSKDRQYTLKIMVGKNAVLNDDILEIDSPNEEGL